MRLSRQRVLGVLFALLVSAVVVQSVRIPARVDHWQYASWWVEDVILATGRTVSCEAATYGTNYAVYWPKICGRLEAPTIAYVKVITTELTGLDFAGAFQRFFILTALVKAFAGYKLASLYTSDSRSKYLGAALLTLTPDYSPLYLTTAKGLSFAVFLFGSYSLIRWVRHRERLFFIFTIIFSSSLSLLYLPRAILFVAFIGILAISKAQSEGGKLFTGSLVLPLLLYLIQFDRVINNVARLALLPSRLEGSLSLAMSRLPLIGSASGTPVPFSLSWPPYITITLLPIALVAGVSGLNELRKKRLKFLLDERMVWLYAISLVYIPAGLTVSFFWSRVIFEAAVPGILVAVSQFDRLWGEIKWENTTDTAAVLLVLIVTVGQLAVIPGVWTYPYEGDYGGFSDSLEAHGIDEDTPVFTDIKTGGYLVGEEGYRQVYRLTTDYNRSKIAAVWHGTNSTAACRVISSLPESPEYIIVNDEVAEEVVYVENYPRRPINRSAREKFDREPFSKTFVYDDFTVYKLNC